MKLRSDHQGVLILSHCGYSYFEKLSELVRQLGLKVFTLTSLPIRQKGNRLKMIREGSSMAFVSESTALTWSEVLDVLVQLTRQGNTVIACISVWEGYRALMARANARVGAYDLSPSIIEKLCDKYTLRQYLHSRHLTHVNSELLDEESFEAHRNATQTLRKFVKPRIGVASYAAFELTPEVRWEDLCALWESIKTDKEFGSLCKDSGFLVEDYILGREFSFEIICYFGQVYVLAIHEKIEVSSSKHTMLEESCVSPPIHLGLEEMETAVDWISMLMKQLNLFWGCFHLEAKYHEGCWEVIEINPRTGGALISKSVSLLSEGKNLLHFWLLTLIHRSGEGRGTVESALNRYQLLSDFSRSRDWGTYFRVYFAQSGKRIKTIRKRALSPKPDQVDVFYKPGEVVIDVPREVFLAQAIWKVDYKNTLPFQKNVIQIGQSSEQLIEVDYAA